MTAATTSDGLTMAEWFAMPRPYVLTYTVRWRRWLPIRVRETWEKVCTWDEALAQQAEMRRMGLTDCEVRLGR